MRPIQSESVEYNSDRKVSFPSLISLTPPLISIPLQLSLIVEYSPGRVMDTIDRLIALYLPDSVVVGTRGIRSRMAMSLGTSYPFLTS